jgi:hypothetical protein
MSSKEYNFEIGQVVYLLSQNAEAIIPAVVVEEQMVKKINGNSTSWKVIVGPENNRKEFQTNSMKDELYSSLEEVRGVMLKRFNDFVEELTSKASMKTEEWYGQHIIENNDIAKLDPEFLTESFSKETEQQQQYQQNPAVAVRPNDDFSNITIKAPTITGPLQNHNKIQNGPLININPNDPKADIKRQLLEMTMDDDVDFGATDYNKEFIITDDGRTIPVKFKQ